LPPRASLLLGCIRPHWRIENRFHWGLDALFHEDHSRTPTGDGAENLALLPPLPSIYSSVILATERSKANATALL